MQQSGEDEAARRRRLAYRSRYRGFREADIIFSRFVETHLGSLNGAQLDQYERLLAESDHDLYAWVTGKRPVPARHDHALMRMLQALDLTIGPDGV